MELTDFEKGRIHELKQLAVDGKAKINMIGFRDYVFIQMKNIKDDAKKRARTRPVSDSKKETGADK